MYKQYKEYIHKIGFVIFLVTLIIWAASQSKFSGTFMNQPDVTKFRMKNVRFKSEYKFTLDSAQMLKYNRDNNAIDSK